MEIPFTGALSKERHFWALKPCSIRISPCSFTSQDALPK
jgi:hypothetical protein